MVGCVDGWVRMFDIRDERSDDQMRWEKKVIEGEALTTVSLSSHGHLAFGTENLEMRVCIRCNVYLLYI